MSNYVYIKEEKVNKIKLKIDQMINVAMKEVESEKKLNMFFSVLKIGQESIIIYNETDNRFLFFYNISILNKQRLHPSYTYARIIKALFNQIDEHEFLSFEELNSSIRLDIILDETPCSIFFSITHEEIKGNDKYIRYINCNGNNQSTPYSYLSNNNLINVYSKEVWLNNNAPQYVNDMKTIFLNKITLLQETNFEPFLEYSKLICLFLDKYYYETANDKNIRTINNI